MENLDANFIKSLLECTAVPYYFFDTLLSCLLKFLSFISSDLYYTLIICCI